MLDFEYLKSLSPEAGEEYLRQALSGGLGEYVPGGEGSGFGEGAVPGEPGYYSALGRGVNVIDGWEGYGQLSEYDAVAPGTQRIRQAIIDGPDDRSYVATFDQEGNLTDVGRQLEDSWYDKEIAGVPLGMFLPVAAAAGASLIGGAGAGGAAGVSPYSLAQPGTSVTLGGSTTTLGGGSIGGGALGSGLTPGVVSGGISAGAGASAFGPTFASELLPEVVSVDTLLGGTSGAAGPDVLTSAVPDGLGNGTYGMNSSYTTPELAALESSTLPVLTPEMTAMGYTALPSGAALEAGIGGLAAGPGAAGAMSFLDASKAAIDAGAAAGGTSSVLDTIVSAAKGAKDLSDKVPSWLKTAAGKLIGGSSGSGGSGGFGNLGSIGGLLGLALMIAQARRDQNAPTATTPLIPRMRSRVEQKPFTLDDSGKKRAPLAYFGNPVYYAAGGGVAGLAAGGNTSRAIRGPGDGTSDSIPATINGKEPAALADGEYVIDARAVAEIGNGSTEAGTRKLDAMIARIHADRTHAKRGEDSNADRHLLA